MDAIPNDQMKKRAELREQCSQAVSRLLQAIDSQLKAAYPRDELTSLGVSLEPFDPNNQEFVNSKACLFEPLSSEALEKYSLVESELCGGALDYYFEFDKLYDHPTNMKNAPSYIMAERADQIFNHLEILHKHYEIKNGKDLDFLEEVSGWDEIKEGSSFLDGPMGLFYGFHRGLPDWNTKARREWQEDDDDPKTIYPHMMLVICTGAETKDDELLLGELGSIAQTIQNRLNQMEFEKTSLFPVLAISFFGPRHGRILQARFNESGILKVRVSPIYSFLRKAEAPFKLFLRYYACEPQDGPEYELYNDIEDAPIQIPKYVSSEPRYDKENVAPKEDHPSFFPESHETCISLC